MTTDLSKMTVDKLHGLTKEIEKEIKTRESEKKKAEDREKREQRRAVIKELRETISKNQISPEELTSPQKRVPSGDKRKDGSKSPPKYRDIKDSSRTWTGKGRKPSWFSEAEARGVPRASMLIPG
ncbi:DNA-binding protein H-NS [Gammaproteobacteria bacterium]